MYHQAVVLLALIGVLVALPVEDQQTVKQTVPKSDELIAIAAPQAQRPAEPEEIFNTDNAAGKADNIDLETANTFWGGYGLGGGYYRRPYYGYGGGYGGYGGLGYSGWRRGWGGGYGGRGFGGGYGWGGRYWG